MAKKGQFSFQCSHFKNLSSLFYASCPTSVGWTSDAGPAAVSYHHSTNPVSQLQRHSCAAFVTRNIVSLKTKHYMTYSR